MSLFQTQRLNAYPAGAVSYTELHKVFQRVSELELAGIQPFAYPHQLTDIDKSILTRTSPADGNVLFAFKSADTNIVTAVASISNIASGPELGVIVNPELRGKRFAEETMEAMATFAFSRLPDVDAVFARVAARNHASIRVLDKNGFSALGACKSPLKNYDGKQYLLYGLTRKNHELRIPGFYLKD